MLHDPKPGCVSDLNIAWYVSDQIGNAGYKMPEVMADEIALHLKSKSTCECYSIYQHFVLLGLRIKSDEILMGRICRDE